MKLLSETKNDNGHELVISSIRVTKETLVSELKEVLKLAKDKGYEPVLWRFSSDIQTLLTTMANEKTSIYKIIHIPADVTSGDYSWLICEKLIKEKTKDSEREDEPVFYRFMDENKKELAPV